MDTSPSSRSPHCFGAITAAPCPHCGWKPGPGQPTTSTGASVGRWTAATASAGCWAMAASASPISPGMTTCICGWPSRSISPGIARLSLTRRGGCCKAKPVISPSARGGAANLKDTVLPPLARSITGLKAVIGGVVLFPFAALLMKRAEEIRAAQPRLQIRLLYALSRLRRACRGPRPATVQGQNGASPPRASSASLGLTMK